jgi:small-conductance mechanosensitive channel
MAEKQLKVGDRVKWNTTKGNLVEIRTEAYGVFEFKQGQKIKRMPVLLNSLKPC